MPDTAEPPRDSSPDQISADLLRHIAASRVIIEQAKGVLMFVYGVDADGAFDVLKWRSQATNVKVRVVAAEFVDGISALSPDQRRNMQSACDALLFARVSDHAPVIT